MLLKPQCGKQHGKQFVVLVGFMVVRVSCAFCRTPTTGVALGLSYL